MYYISAQWRGEISGSIRKHTRNLDRSLLKLISSNYFFQEFICNEEDKKLFIMTISLFNNAVEH